MWLVTFQLMLPFIVYQLFYINKLLYNLSYHSKYDYFDQIKIIRLFLILLFDAIQA